MRTNKDVHETDVGGFGSGTPVGSKAADMKALLTDIADILRSSSL